MLAGISDQVEAVAGDITCMPFPDTHFDSIISTNAIDHLGRTTSAGLAELHRTLKLGGRILLVMWEPGWTTFTIARLACLFLDSPRALGRRFSAAGFTVEDHGSINGRWYVVAADGRQIWYNSDPRNGPHLHSELPTASRRFYRPAQNDREAKGELPCRC